MHGFARILEWTVSSVTVEDDGSVVAEFALADHDATRMHFAHSFAAKYRVRIGRRLELTFEVENRDSSPFTFEAALHTYFRVSDVRTVEVTGLENTEFIDKVDGFNRKRHGTEPLRFTGETDPVTSPVQATKCQPNAAVASSSTDVPCG